MSVSLYSFIVSQASATPSLVTEETLKTLRKRERERGGGRGRIHVDLIVMVD